MTTSVRWGSATDIGRRAINQDAFLSEPPFFLVADGMGGHAAGEVASALAIERFKRFAGSSAVDRWSVVAAIRDANEEIFRHGSDDHYGMGTTIAGIALTRVDAEDAVLAFNVGDSRVYRFTDRLVQISTDHSEVAELIDRGEITPDEARTHARRNVVTRALGLGLNVEIDSWLLPAVAGELFIVCSDGVTGDLTDEQIARLIGGSADPLGLAEELVAAALASGARDNVTAVVVAVDQVESGGSVDDEDTDPRIAEDVSKARTLIVAAPAGAQGVSERPAPAPLINAVPGAVQSGPDPS